MVCVNSKNKAPLHLQSKWHKLFVKWDTVIGCGYYSIPVYRSFYGWGVNCENFSSQHS